MLISTTNNLDGYKVREYLGIVHADFIIAANIFRDWFAGIINFMGGRGRGYEKELRKARSAALQRITDIAKDIRADGVVGVRIDYEFIPIAKRGGMLMVCVSGTAVRLTSESEPCQPAIHAANADQSN